MDLINLSDKDIFNYILPKGKIIPQRCVKKVLVKKGFYEYLLNRYSDNTIDKNNESLYIRETLYRMIHNIDTIPVCKICGTKLKFSGVSYPNYCSRNCSNHDEDVIKKMSESCSKSLKHVYEKNGDDIKRKRKETLSKKYNINVEKPTPFSIKEIKDYADKRIKELYGVDNTFQLNWVREKNKISQRDKSIKKQLNRGIDVEHLENGEYLVKNCCPIHGDLIYSQKDFCNRFKLNRYMFSNPCYICNPYGYHISGQEKTILDYIKSIYNDEIIENDKTILDGLEIDIYLPKLKIGFEFQGDYWHMNPLKYKYDDINPTTKITASDKWESDRYKILLADKKGIKLYNIWEYYFINYKDNVLDFICNIIQNNINYIHPLIKLKHELDNIDDNYILKKNMFFEYENVRIIYLDGFYFNKNTITKEYLSSLMSKSKRNIFVYDYEITDDRKFQILLSNIKYSLYKIKNKIRASKCELKEITNKQSRQFLIDNCLFGYRSASKVIGLYYNNELVMVYSFGNNYYGRNKYTEIIRVCTKKDTQVLGGNSKCLKYYINNYSHTGERMIFYVDSIHHDGKTMSKEGYTHVRHVYGTMNYYITFDRLGESFNRNPNKNKEIKDLIKKGEVVEVITNGVDVFEKII